LSPFVVETGIIATLDEWSHVESDPVDSIAIHAMVSARIGFLEPLSPSNRSYRNSIPAGKDFCSSFSRAFSVSFAWTTQRPIVVSAIAGAVGPRARDAKCRETRKLVDGAWLAVVVVKREKKW
jgi:hypothetical protein